ncbi:MAG: chemotaxis response regulator protein-glutamate methylesterase [Verrucomicrobia bacterium SCN 57-15]|nr:MAG: chemotaxis response regulator protein-glutamate methylesterase [Verrucomicrobia bacterium SCN 57-15]
MSAFNPVSSAKLIRVLIVDDSAFVRKVVKEMLTRSPFIEVVGIARDGEEALGKASELKPDVITCDIVMPKMDGVEFVRQQMARQPIPILILSASPADGELVLQAMEAGAVDFVQKPSSLASDDLLGVREELIEKVKGAATAPIKNLHVDAAPSPLPKAVSRAPRADVVLIGISTGGPQALRFLLPQFPKDFPVPILVVLHMPVGYTEMFAAKLDELSQIEVVEAAEGQVLRPGLAILGQAGFHLKLARGADGLVRTSLATQPRDKPHRPSVDVLFQSAAELFDSRTLAIVMTGMGNDGTEGAAWIKAKGGKVLTEAEESCVIYGMPRSVDEAGLSDGHAPLHDMARTILKNL